MNDLVIVRNNEVLTDSLIIADGTQNQHKNVKELIKNYERQLLELETFGISNAETFSVSNVESTNRTLTILNRQSTGGRPEQYYELNEPQATFLITLLKNTPVVVSFKLKLVKQFYQMRMLIQNGAIQMANPSLGTYIADVVSQELDRRLEVTQPIKEKPLEMAFIDAINAALSEGYYFYRRRNKSLSQGENKLIGTYDSDYYYIIGKRAYDLYAASMETPAPMKGVYAYLLSGGFIEPNTRKVKKQGFITYQKSIKGKIYSCLVFYADKVKFSK